MVGWVRTMVVLLVLFGAHASHAVQVDEMLPDPVLEGRARELSHELRCMVCQNQSIDDSEAPLARDLRLLVRERLKAGDSDNQVLDYLVARYGEFVLLKPRLSSHTLLLWGAPLAILLAGLFAIGFSVLRRPAGYAPAEVAALSEAERQKLNAIAPAPSASEPRSNELPKSPAHARSSTSAAQAGN
jgi:cytochrome c-type biogenesis protein CcmH